VTDWRLIVCSLALFLAAGLIVELLQRGKKKKRQPPS
jgi:hypothetical protein